MIHACLCMNFLPSCTATISIYIGTTVFLIIYNCTVADLGGSWGSMEPPFGLDLLLRGTDDRLNGTPLSG